MSINPWTDGPLELLKHGLEHLSNGTDFDRRIAMISIDNAVELMIKTYLSLPLRVTGGKMSRKKRTEAFQNFPSLLDGLENFASDIIVGIALSDIEWFHNVRNMLYHEGNAITVESGKVESYAEIAKILFVRLFDISLDDLPDEVEPKGLISEFLSNWTLLGQELARIQNKQSSGDRNIPTTAIIDDLLRRGIIKPVIYNQFSMTRKFYNLFAHGLTTPSKEQIKKYLDIITLLLMTFSDI